MFGIGEDLDTSAVAAVRLADLFDEGRLAGRGDFNGRFLSFLDRNEQGAGAKVGRGAFEADQTVLRAHLVLEEGAAWLDGHLSAGLHLDADRGLEAPVDEVG